MANRAVFGIFGTKDDAWNAINSLRRAQYRNTDISVLFPENEGTKDLGHEKHTKAPEGAATGTASGVMLGGALGWLVGIGALTIPGLGPLIIAGPIVSAFAGAGAGAVTGGLIGALTGLGMPEYEALRYEGRVKDGGILLSVHCDDSEWVSRAKEILESNGAHDIASAPEAHADFARTDKPRPRRVAL